MKDIKMIKYEELSLGIRIILACGFVGFLISIGTLIGVLL